MSSKRFAVAAVVGVLGLALSGCVSEGYPYGGYYETGPYLGYGGYYGTGPYLGYGGYGNYIGYSGIGLYGGRYRYYRPYRHYSGYRHYSHRSGMHHFDHDRGRFVGSRRGGGPGWLNAGPHQH